MLSWPYGIHYFVITVYNTNDGYNNTDPTAQLIKVPLQKNSESIDCK